MSTETISGLLRSWFHSPDQPYRLDAARFERALGLAGDGHGVDQIATALAVAPAVVRRSLSNHLAVAGCAS